MYHIVSHIPLYAKNITNGFVAIRMVVNFNFRNSFLYKQLLNKNYSVYTYINTNNCMDP